MPYRIQAQTQDSAISVIVETAREALAKLAEFVELGYAVVIEDMMGAVVDAASLDDVNRSAT